MTTTTTPSGAIVGSTAGPIDIEALRALADQAGSEIVTIQAPAYGLPDATPVFLDRKNGKVSSLKQLIEENRSKPARKTGTATVNTLDSFIALTARHMTEDSVIFADTDWRKPSLTTIVDYHAKPNGGTADNGTHRIHYPFPLSEEWQAWVDQDGKKMDQTTFAEWIEDHLAELAAPTEDEKEMLHDKFSLKVAAPNEMVMLSRGLQIHIGSRVKNNVVLQSGEGEITWEETHMDAAGNKLVVPGLFILALPPFFMGAPTRIPVRLRYKAAGSGIIWTFKLYRPDVYITEQIEADLETAMSATALPAFRGAPEMKG